MSQPPYHPNRFIGNVAAVVLIALGMTYLFDNATQWLGHPTRTFCVMVDFLAPISFAAGVVLATLGILIWVISTVTRSHGGAGVGLLIGGALLSALPNVMPHYFGLACLPSP